MTVAAACAAVALDAWWVAFTPLVPALAVLAIVDFRKVFYLMMACIPISMEQELPGGLGTDFPSEQLMWLLFITSGLWFIQNWRQIDARFIRHPIALALFAHLAWMSVCVITSQDLVYSVKHWMAKAWYVGVFFFLAGGLLQTEKDLRVMFWWFFIPLQLAMLIVLGRHAAIGFSFKEVEYVMGPFFRNHVMYACLLAVFIPFLWFAAQFYPRFSKNWWVIGFGFVSFIVGINFAYTRAAYVALLAALAMYWIVRRRMTQYVLILAGFLLVLLFWFISLGDNWLRFAPDYERTVTHTRFENLIEATTKLEDISTMERVYRWVAGTYMIREKPLHGFGPGTFYLFYKNYTVTSFQTYVSDNPEKSSIHNYFLMMMVEQGIPGFLFFVLLVVVAIMKGQQIYHQGISPAHRRMTMTALLVFMLINLLMLMNDLVETDKIGSLFFISLALLINSDFANRRGNSELNK